VYPLLLPASTDPALSLTIQNSAAGSYGLGVGLAWFIPGMLLAGAYATFTYRRFSGKIL
jgi:cytochrome d ubiquinol oxidase subunit II